MWQNSKTQNVTYLKDSKCDKTQKLKIKQKSKKSICDKNQKLKMWPKSKTQNVTKLKNMKGDKTQKLKIWQNSTTQIQKKTKKKSINVTKLKKKRSNCEKPYLLEFWKQIIN